MPTPFAHALAGTAVYLSASRGGRRREDLVLFTAAVVAACFADLDFGLNFLTGENYHHYFTAASSLSRTSLEVETPMARTATRPWAKSPLAV